MDEHRRSRETNTRRQERLRPTDTDAEVRLGWGCWAATGRPGSKCAAPAQSKGLAPRARRSRPPRDPPGQTVFESPTPGVGPSHVTPLPGAFAQRRQRRTAGDRPPTKRVRCTTGKSRTRLGRSWAPLAGRSAGGPTNRPVSNTVTVCSIDRLTSVPAATAARARGASSHGLSVTWSAPPNCSLIMHDCGSNFPCT